MNTSNVFSAHNTTTDANMVAKQDIENEYKQLYINIEWWMTTVSHLVLPILGGFGNILTFMVMRRRSVKEVSTCFYMSMLALVDTGKYITKGCVSVFL